MPTEPQNSIYLLFFFYFSFLVKLFEMFNVRFLVIACMHIRCNFLFRKCWLLSMPFLFFLSFFLPFPYIICFLFSFPCRIFMRFPNKWTFERFVSLTLLMVFFYFNFSFLLLLKRSEKDVISFIGWILILSIQHLYFVWYKSKLHRNYVISVIEM